MKNDMPAPTDTARNPVYFMVHVPKCAGGTVHHFLSERLAHAEYIELQNAPKLRRLFGRPHYSTRHGPRHWQNVRAVSGHPLARSFAARFGDRPVRESVLLRDPAGHLTSQYNQKINARRGRQNGLPSFETWFQTRPANPISTFLLYRYFEMPMRGIILMSDQEKLDFLTDSLSRFWFVGDYRHCDLLLERLSADLALPEKTWDKGIRPPGHKVVDPASLPDRVRRKIESDSAVDLELHRRFRDRLWDADASFEAVVLPDTGLAARSTREARRMFHMAAGLFNRREASFEK